MNSRRNFLRTSITGSLAALAAPVLASGQSPLTSPAGQPDETYWKKVKEQFPIRPGFIMMNAANLCPSPTAVNETWMTFQRSLAADVSMQYRSVFSEHRKKALGLFATFVNASADEIGITRNTSESNCTIIHGLDFQAGDEVILWDQNHPSNKEIWMKLAERTGIVIRLVTLPETIPSPTEAAGYFKRAFTSKTRLIAFSHISNVTGTALPAAELCAYARERNVLSLVDGAQTLGFHNVDVKKLGCDFYTASTHKWLMGPIENGILYIRREHIGKVWPSITGGGWHDGASSVDDKLCFLGQRNDPSTAALPDIVAFHETIGKENIQNRVVELNRFLKEQIAVRLPQARFVTPLAPELSGGIVIVAVPGKEAKNIVQALYANHGVAAATTGGVRLSPHIYNTKEDVAATVDALVKCCA